MAYCPDQLGPAVNRLLPAGRYLQTTFPRGTGPAFVNWVDYARRGQGGLGSDLRPTPGVDGGGRQADLSGVGRRLPGFGLKCEGIVQTLQANPDYRAQQLVAGNAATFYQPMWMVRFTPIRS